jgi:hypothetical protein
MLEGSIEASPDPAPRESGEEGNFHVLAQILAGVALQGSDFGRTTYTARVRLI